MTPPGRVGWTSIFHFSPGASIFLGGAVAAAGRNSGKADWPSTAGGRPSTISTPESWAARSKRTTKVRSGEPGRRSCTCTRTSSGLELSTVSVASITASSTVRSGASLPMVVVVTECTLTS